MASTAPQSSNSSSSHHAPEGPPAPWEDPAMLAGPPLTDEEKAYLKKHAGHEGMHLAMILILMVSLLIMQVALVEWRRRKPKSYAYASLAGLALVPLLLSLNAGFTRFISIYALFAVANSWVVYRASRKPISSGTPRAVYRWFAAIYQISYALGILGYAVILLTIFGISGLFVDGPDAFSFGMLTMFYGLYFGVLSRDLVEVLADHMASSIGYYSPEGLPQKYLRESTCAVCGDTTLTHPDANSNPDHPNPTHTLNCHHVFHEQCIRGWAIIGKKDICPYCREKVDMSAFHEHVWDKAQHYYLQLIDMLRYLVVWQPLIFLAVQEIYKVFGME
ncbi:hypothetical protein BC828DRAFT_385086 [Blastocladiella britannica]|nr:hypothetical protein BC828DRAFT_385086 [Blastocladiella britannica]